MTLPPPLRVATLDLAYAIELCCSTSDLAKLGMAAAVAETAAERIRGFCNNPSQGHENIMAADFKSLLQRPMDDIAVPPAWPAGTYHGIVKKHEFGESSQKKTPYVRYVLGITEAAEDVDQSALEGIVLSEREFNADFYLTETSMYRVKDFLESVGVSVEGRSLGECIPEAANAHVLITMTQKNSDDGKRIFNQVGEVKGAE